jgi:hypothetical protein
MKMPVCWVAASEISFNSYQKSWPFNPEDSHFQHTDWRRKVQNLLRANNYQPAKTPMNTTYYIERFVCYGKDPVLFFFLSCRNVTEDDSLLPMMVEAANTFEMLVKPLPDYIGVQPRRQPLHNNRLENLISNTNKCSCPFSWRVFWLRGLYVSVL